MAEPEPCGESLDKIWNSLRSPAWAVLPFPGTGGSVSLHGSVLASEIAKSISKCCHLINIHQERPIKYVYFPFSAASSPLKWELFTQELLS